MMKVRGEIRLMRSADLPRCDALRHLAGWNQTMQDWRRFLELSPQGCFVAEESGGVMGTVTTMAYSGEVGWIGMLLVDPEKRGQGIGQALLTRAMEHLQRAGIACIKLDATEAGLPLYRKIGFQVEGEVRRLRIENKISPGVLRSGFAITALPQSSAHTITILDAQAFGAARSDLIGSLLASATAAVGIREERCLVACALLRTGTNANYLGPAVTRSEAMAEALVHKLIAQSEQRPLYWDVPCANPMALKLADRFGFTPERSLIRLFLGARHRAGDTGRYLAIADPSLG